ncbi:hypothetical protein DFJ74DRAFT_774904 [Hyaloraphidium curvatum]|nr:hypothetical protein DFJ74DRAFT_774904 [Hyaloraphidium curvatum]
MLTKADDYPIHQTAEPIAFSGTDRNFYDRYFFNGYSKDGSLFFAAAFGVYPHVNICDGAFCVSRNGTQHNLHASRWLMHERMDTHVGPIAVDIVEPLRVLRVRVGDSEHPIRAELTFTGRTAAIKEPRFTRRIGARTLMDVTRMTQNGAWEGWIELKGERIEVKADATWGTRDRSWGVRTIGSADPQPMAPPAPFQFYWLWAPLNFGDRITLYHVNDDAEGEAWNQAGAMALTAGGEPEHVDRCRSEVKYVSGSRYAKEATITFEHDKKHGGGTTTIKLTPKFNFHMMGLGYMNPEWGHGMHKGELAVGYDEFKPAEIKSCAPPHLHVQAFVQAEMTLPDGSKREGCGILEQLVLGPHKPSGFKETLDVAP